MYSHSTRKRAISVELTLAAPGQESGHERDEVYHTDDAAANGTGHLMGDAADYEGTEGDKQSDDGNAPRA